MKVKYFSLFVYENLSFDNVSLKNEKATSPEIRRPQNHR
jgi:hypothetical protein